MVEQVIRTYGRIDILVHVAGILRDRMIFNMAEGEWDAVIAVHLTGMFNTVRAAAVAMREARGGRIISMSSVSALGAPGQPNYAAAKAGILGLTWSTANALAKYRSEERLNSSHLVISYAVFCLKKKNKLQHRITASL